MLCLVSVIFKIHLKRALGMEKRQPVVYSSKNFHYSTHTDLEWRLFHGKLRKALILIKKSVFNVLVSYLKILMYRNWGNFEIVFWFEWTYRDSYWGLDSCSWNTWLTSRILDVALTWMRLEPRLRNLRLRSWPRAPTGTEDRKFSERSNSTKFSRSETKKNRNYEPWTT